MSFSRQDSGGVRKLSFAKKLAITSRQISDEIRHSELEDRNDFGESNIVSNSGNNINATSAGDNYNNNNNNEKRVARLESKRISMSELDQYADQVFANEIAVRRRPSGLDTMGELGATLDDVMGMDDDEEDILGMNQDGDMGDIDAIIRQPNFLHRKKSNYSITEEDLQYILESNIDRYNNGARRKVTVEKRNNNNNNQGSNNATTTSENSRDSMKFLNGTTGSMQQNTLQLSGESFSLPLPPQKKSRKKKNNNNKKKNDIPSDVAKYTPKVAKAHQYFKFRKGKWADAETEYFELLVRLFAEGLLDVLFNYPLRMFLAHSMACDPMRISKKFVGNKQIGKQRYMPLSYADIDAYDKNKLKAIARKFNAVQDEFKKLLHQDIEAGPIDGVWISQDDILLRVLWPEVVRNEERRRSTNNFNEDDIQSFELAPGAQNTRQGNVTSDSIDDTLFNGLSGAGGFGIDNGNNNEFLDNNMMDDEQQTKVPSMNLPKHVKKKPIRLPKIIVETRDPTKYTVGGVFQNGKYIGKVLEIDYSKSELLVEVHKQRYSLSDVKSGKITAKRTR